MIRATTGVHFCDISTSKSGPELVCVVHFDLEMCFAPQQRALFRHLNFQKWSRAGVLCAFLTWKCASRHNSVHFSTSQLPKVVQSWCALCIFDLEMCFAPQQRALFRHLNFQKWSRAGVLCAFLTWKCASRHNSVHFSTSQLPKVVQSWCALCIFDLETRFAPQQRALFRNLNFQKWSGAGVLCTF